jgi:hypothetical protein
LYLVGLLQLVLLMIHYYRLYIRFGSRLQQDNVLESSHNIYWPRS